MNEPPDAKLQDAKLQEAAQRLGARAAERVDVEATARAVLERLKIEPRVSARRWTRPVWLRVAAALVLLLGGAVLARNALQPPAELVAIPSGADLNGLSPAELQELLAGLDQTLNAAASQTDSLDHLNDLTEEQLRAVLESLEG